jgi:hypothetical protein
MDEISIDNIYQLSELNGTLNLVQQALSEKLDEEAVLKNELYKLLAKYDVPDKLTLDSKIIALKKHGEEEITQKFIEAEKDVAKLKLQFRQVCEAINSRKHINNILPK